MDSHLDREIAREAKTLEKQIRVDVMPSAELVSDQYGVTETVDRRPDVNQPNVVADFFVDTTRQRDYEAGKIANHKVIQTLGITACDERRDLLRFEAIETLNPILFAPAIREYRLVEDPFLHVINDKVLGEFDFTGYRGLSDLALHICSGFVNTREVAKHDNFLDKIYGEAFTALKEVPREFVGYTHLVNGPNMAQIDSIFGENNEVMYTIRVEAMDPSQFPKIWEHYGEVKVVEPKNPREALNSLQKANSLIKESLSFPQSW